LIIYLIEGLLLWGRCSSLCSIQVWRGLIVDRVN